MRRREFITLLGGAAVAWPLAARAQQPAMPVIGFVGTGAAAPNELYVASLTNGLKSTGYIVGQNVSIEYRWAEGHYEQLFEMAAELVARNVAAIVAYGGNAPVTGGKVGEPYYSNRIYQRRRSGQGWPRCPSQSTGGECHWGDNDFFCGGRQAPGALA